MKSTYIQVNNEWKRTFIINDMLELGYMSINENFQLSIALNYICIEQIIRNIKTFFLYNYQF